MHAAAPAPRLEIVVPCYNEQEVLPETCRQLTELIGRLQSLGKIAPGSHVTFVDDGSRDQTWQLIERYAAQDLPITGIKLSRNRGHQNALLCGLLSSSGDVVVSIDADLQDDPSAIEAMVDEHAKGFEIVYGVRRTRSVDTWFKRRTAEGFYRLLELFGVDTVYNHADYRLMSRRAILALASYPEVNLYLRGMIPLLGLRSTTVDYDRAARFAGKSKYPISRMLGLAWQAISSFSIVPLRMITALGFLIFTGTMIASLWILWARFVADSVVPGWASTVLPLFLLGGLQMLGLGVVGEYLGKIYLESKSRPRYLVERRVASPLLAQDLSPTEATERKVSADAA